MYDEAIEKQKSIYAEAWQKATGTGGEDSTMSKARAMRGKFSYFDHEGAKFRRDDSNGSRGVDDVLFGREWHPYKGDALKPATFGDQIDDPLAGEDVDQDAREPEMAKSLASRLGDGLRVLLRTKRKA